MKTHQYEALIVGAGGAGVQQGPLGGQVQRGDQHHRVGPARQHLLVLVDGTSIPVTLDRSAGLDRPELERHRDDGRTLLDRARRR